MTIKEICEYIAKWIKDQHGYDMPPEEIYNFSHIGELQHVFSLYDEAKQYYAKN